LGKQFKYLQFNLYKYQNQGDQEDQGYQGYQEYQDNNNKNNGPRMNHNNKFNCVYSIGKRCGTEMILKELKLVRFSSVVGSCCTASIRKFLFFLDSKFDILFNKKYLIYTKDIPKFKELPNTKPVPFNVASS
jgi:hypothetical protein